MDISLMQNLARLIRYYILTSTTAAGSGHMTSAMSPVELATVLFFRYFRANLDKPKDPANDRFILSKGHASPLLYALYATAGKITEEEMLTLRNFGSALEGHPGNRFSFADVATGSLGQGLSVGVGEAIGIRKMVNSQLSIVNRNNNQKASTNNNFPYIYVLLGDGEMAEGQVWEAIELASYYKLNNLIALIDVNRLGQSQPTMLGDNVQAYARRVSSFGWRTYVVEDGHDLELLDKAYSLALADSSTHDSPAAIIVKTVKGKGVALAEDKTGWHGIPLTRDQLQQALDDLGPAEKKLKGEVNKPEVRFEIKKSNQPQQPDNQFYDPVTPVSTRKAFGNALVRLGEYDPDLVVLDGDVQNSTYTGLFAQKYPDRFFQMYIAEQNLVSCALGLSVMGFKPFVSTFGCFLTRAHDQIRMAAISHASIRFCGSHAGVSIGADGPTQMGLEDVAMFRSVLGSVVLYPADPYATEYLTGEMLKHDGISYIRTNRPDTPVIYTKDDRFPIGGSKVFNPLSHTPSLITIVAAGITLHEALESQKELSQKGIGVRVIDCYSVKPIDTDALKLAVDQSKAIIVAEDHYPEGGLGEAVKSALAEYAKIPIYHLAVTKLPMSGKAEELLDFESISSNAIRDRILSIL